MKTRRGPAGRGPSRKTRSFSRPLLERVEDRLLLTTFTVNQIADSGLGTLRQAIMDSNASSTALPNRIVFDLPSTTLTITPLSPLPQITQTVTIDGTSQPGYDPNNPAPLVEIRGDDPANSGGGFTITAAQSNIVALVIDRFNGPGVTVNGVQDAVQGCYIGVDPTGENLAPNNGPGILVSGPGAVIGGSTLRSLLPGTPNQGRNVISGNTTGITITGANATQTQVQGNFIGTDAMGLTRLGNTAQGVLNLSGNNTIGGQLSIANNRITGDGNVISGNRLANVQVGGPGAAGPIDLGSISGNFIGTDATGLSGLLNDPLPANGRVVNGVDIIGASTISIGSFVSTSFRNVISFNSGNGIQVQSASTQNTSIEGNDIGVGVDGTTPLGNGAQGVLVSGASNTEIGGAFLGTQNVPAGFANIIANNGRLVAGAAGVLVSGAQNVGILTNSIYNNSGLGIRLNAGNQGVLPPTLNSVQTAMTGQGTGKTQITGSYFGTPSTNVRLQFFSNQTPDPSLSGEGQTFIGSVDVTTDKTGNVNFSAVLNVAVPVGFFISATATEGLTTINNTSQFSVDVQATQALVSDLAVTTSVPQVPPLLGQNYTFSVTVTNNGPNDATGVILTDTIPANATFVSASQGTFFGRLLTVNIGNLAAGSSVTVNITVKPNSVVGGFTNLATVTGNQLDSNTNNNTSRTTNTVAADADIAVILMENPNPAPVGSPITYTLVVSNNGPSTANDATATVDLDGSLSNVNVNPDQGTFSIANNMVSINLGILPSGSSSTTVITATPNTVGQIFASAMASSSLADPNPANNTATNGVFIANAADLALAINSTPNPVLVGQELFYFISVTNNGPSQATRPVVTDQLPAGLTFVPADSNAGGNGTVSIANGVVTATLNPIDPGATDLVTVAVIPTASGQVVNTATVADPNLNAPAEIDSDLTNNTASTTTLVSPADIGVTILNPADPLLIGQPAVFQIVINNAGPATATNVVLNDSFGPNATIVGSSVGVASGGNLVVNVGSIPSGGTTTVTITATPTISGPLLDNAAVTSDEIDPNPTDNSATSSNLVSPVDLAVTVAGSPNPVLIGGEVVYLVTVTNNGPTTATNVLFSDVLPGAATLDSATTSQGVILPSSPSTINGNLGTIAPGGKVNVVILVTTNAVSTATDTASVTSDGFDTNPTNNIASASVSVINLPGTIEVGTPLVFAPENSGFATITLDRVGGTLGTVTVNYDTSNYTAVAGVNYTATHGVATFVDGQSVATITIPVLDDLKVDGNTAFFVTLSNATGGATLGPDNIAAVLVTNTDRDTIPPVVSSLIAIPSGPSLVGFVLFFDKPLFPGTASLVSNYHVFLSNRQAGGRGETPIPLAAANYNAASNSVTLVPTAPVPANQFYHIVANGSFGNVLTDASGNSLYGDSGVGSNYDVFYGQGNDLHFIDSQDNAVSINLSGGGSMGIFLTPTGQAAGVNLYQVVPRSTRLMGSVRKLSNASSGISSIGSINGLGQFGDVISNLTTPPFYVLYAPVSYVALPGPTVVTAASVSVTSPSVITGKKTVKGPRHA